MTPSPEPIYQCYQIGNRDSMEFGLWHLEQNVKISITFDREEKEIEFSGEIEFESGWCIIVKIEGEDYKARKHPTDLIDKPFTFNHKKRKWTVQLGFEDDDEGVGNRYSKHTQLGKA